MNDLANKLKQIYTTCQLEKFEWKIPVSCPIDIPESEATSYQKNVYLKSYFHRVISKDHDLKSHYWAIQKWGRIGSFKENEKNNLRIRKFIEEISKGKLTKNSFNCISSLSKVASFIEPDKYVIYDSRVIYSLNWLLFNYSTEKSLFPQPTGRSASLAKYDIQTIFRLTKEQLVYRTHENAYHEYCSLVRQLTPLVFDVNSKPFKLEMLLFMIAPTWIVEDIGKTVSVEINTKA